ncbi:MAG: hypothetical protein Kow00124_06420 [Anaerolineae bacterium]
MPTPQDDLLFEPNGREPELARYGEDNAPMLGGERRLWPSLAAHLLSEQHRAHRRGDMFRVWVIRRLRSRLQHEALRLREESSYSGEPLLPFTDEAALAQIEAERLEVLEEMEQARRWRRLRRAGELQDVLHIIDGYIAFWQDQLERRA